MTSASVSLYTVYIRIYISLTLIGEDHAFLPMKSVISKRMNVSFFWQTYVVSVWSSPSPLASLKTRCPTQTASEKKVMSEAGVVVTRHVSVSGSHE